MWASLDFMWEVVRFPGGEDSAQRNGCHLGPQRAEMEHGWKDFLIEIKGGAIWGVFGHLFKNAGIECAN